MFYFTSDTTPNLKGYTLIIPSVSVGNVGQLTVDLYISSLNCTKIGYVMHPAIMPVIGCNPFNDSVQSLMTSSELYADSVRKLIFMHMRSPILQASSQDFLNLLVDWIESNNFVQTIILTGSSYTGGQKDLIEGDKLRYLFTPNMEEVNAEHLRTLRWSSVDKSFPSSNLERRTKDFFPGGGFASVLFDKCAGKSLMCAVLVKYCSEGDNIPDAYHLAEYLDSWIGAIEQGSTNGQKKWKNPTSWNHLFGNSIPNSIY